MILGVVFGVILVIVIIVLFIIYKQKKAKTTKVSNQDLPNDNTYAENQGYHATPAMNMNEMAEAPPDGKERVE